MRIKATNERGHFLNEQQKEVKGKIMETMWNGLFVTLQENVDVFPNPQEIIDLVFSILVMFNRDVIVHTLTNLGLTNQGSKIMRNLFDTIREEVVEKINLAKN